MAVSDPSQEIDRVRMLLERYFDLGLCEIDAVMADWLYRFDIAWIHGAALEALYQGRYKLVSVSQILQLWSRRGQPLRHYSREFESMIAGQPVLFVGLPLPEAPSSQAPSGSVPAAQPLAAQPPADTYNPFLPPLSSSTQLEPTTAAPDLDKANDSAQGLEPALEAAVTPPAAQPDRVKLALPAVGVESTAARSAKPDHGWVYRANGWTSSPVDMGTGHPEPIQPFVPELSSLDLDQRLRAVARRPAPSP